ncbi:MAG: hypothetical protein J07HQW2_00828, partial [Haloquadratum walsbyi J07HQW2]
DILLAETARLPVPQIWDICWFRIYPVLEGLFHPLMYRTSRPMAVPDSRYPYPVTDSGLSFVSYSLRRYSLRWLPIRRNHIRTDHAQPGCYQRSHHTHSTSSRYSTHFLSVPQHRVLRPCSRDTDTAGRTPTPTYEAICSLFSRSLQIVHLRANQQQLY